MGKFSNFALTFNICFVLLVIYMRLAHPPGSDYFVPLDLPIVFLVLIVLFVFLMIRFSSKPLITNERKFLKVINLILFILILLFILYGILINSQKALSVQFNSEAFCNLPFSSESSIQSCYLHLARQTSNTQLCNKLTGINGLTKELCESQIRWSTYPTP